MMNVINLIRKAFGIEHNYQHSDYITALRGISALAIIMLHVFAIGHVFKCGPDFNLGARAEPYILYLSVGAPFFLLLSAYSLCLSSAKKTGIGLSSFYLRRLFRVAPLFYFMTLIVVLWGTSPSEEITPVNILSNILFIFNFIPQYGYFKGIVGASWYIGVIMPFYLVFPFVYRASMKLTTVMKFFALSLIVSFIFRVGIYLMTTRGNMQPLHMSGLDIRMFSEFSIVAAAPFLIMGIITYNIHKLIDNSKEHRTLGGVLLGLTVIAFLGLPSLSESYLLNPIPLKYIMGLFLIALTLSLYIHPNKLLVNRFTVFMGEISYSLYLAHAFVIKKMTGLYQGIYGYLKFDWPAFICCYVLTVIIVTVISLFTYKFIELPGVRLGSYMERHLRELCPSIFKVSIQAHGPVTTRDEQVIPGGRHHHTSP